MKHSKILLRLMQTLTVITAAFIVIMLLEMADVISIPALNDISENIKTKTETVMQKVRRPRAAMSQSYRELLDAGDRSLASGNKDLAIENYRNASIAEPRNCIAYEKLGDVYFSQKSYELSRNNFEMANSLNPTNAMQIKIIKNILGLRRIIEAKTKLEQIQPQNQESMYYLGLISAFLNDQTKAKDLLTQIVNTTPDEKLKSNAQKILDVYRDFELAREAPLEFLQALLAQRFDQIGEYPLAIELAFAAIKKENDYRDIWIILGHAFLNEQKWSDAEDSFIKAIQLDAGHPAPYFFRGIARRNLSKTQEAVDDFKHALSIGWQPRILANWNLAEIYFERKNFEQAFQLYKDVVKTDPSDLRRFIRPIALAVNHLNKPAEALSLAQIANTAHPNTAMAHNLLGWAFLANDNFSESRNHLEQAKTLDPNLDAVYLNLGQLEERTGNFRAAANNYQKAIELAEKIGDTSIIDTANSKYNSAVNRLESQTTGSSTNLQPSTTIPQNIPQSELIPSLSLL